MNTVGSDVPFADRRQVLDDVDCGHGTSTPKSKVTLEPIDDDSFLDGFNIQSTIMRECDNGPWSESCLDLDRVEARLEWNRRQRLSGRPAEPGQAARLLAEQFTPTIMSRRVQEIRRLLIAETPHFPELGRLCRQRGIERVLEPVAACLRVVAQRGLPPIAQPSAAVQHLTGMLVWITSNRVMFCVPEQAPTTEELAAIIDQGVRAVVSAYRPQGKDRTHAEPSGGK